MPPCCLRHLWTVSNELSLNIEKKFIDIIFNCMIFYFKEFRRPERLSRLTVIPGMFRVSIHPVGEPPPNTLTSALQPVKPFPLPPLKL